MNFKEWLELEIFIEMAAAPYVPEEIPSEVKLMVNKMLALAARPLNSKGEHNWMFNSHLYWHDKEPQLVQKIMDLFKERFSHRLPETRTQLRAILRDLVKIVFQKDHGYGTRRQINYAVYKKAEPTAVLTQQYPDAIHRGDGKNPYKRRPGENTEYIQTVFQQKLRRASSMANKGFFGRPWSIADDATKALWGQYKEFLLANREKYNDSSDIPDFEVWLKRMQRRRAV